MSYYFVIVGTKDQPLFEYEFGTSKAGGDGQSKFPPEARRLNQFIVHAALDIAEEVQWTSGAMYLRLIDTLHTSHISLFHTGSRAKFLLLHNPDPPSPTTSHLYPLSANLTPPNNVSKPPSSSTPLARTGSSSNKRPTSSLATRPTSPSHHPHQKSSSTTLSTLKRPSIPAITSGTSGTSGNHPIAHHPTSPQAEEAIRQFFADVYESWVKATMNPFYVLDGVVGSEVFRGRVAASGRKYL